MPQKKYSSRKKKKKKKKATRVLDKIQRCLTLFPSHKSLGFQNHLCSALGVFSFFLWWRKKKDPPKNMRQWWKLSLGTSDIPVQTFSLSAGDASHCQKPGATLDLESFALSGYIPAKSCGLMNHDEKVSQLVVEVATKKPQVVEEPWAASTTVSSATIRIFVVYHQLRFMEWVTESSGPFVRVCSLGWGRTSWLLSSGCISALS